MSDFISTKPTERHEAWWQKRHRLKLTEISLRGQEIETLLLGDSIMHEWELSAHEAFKQYFEANTTLNLGYKGDCTEHLLWRLLNGELNGELNNMQPKQIVLLIGTNNIGHRIEDYNQTLAGIVAIIEQIKQNLPHCKILLHSIFPRSKRANAPLRLRVDALNKHMSVLADNKQIFLIDMTEKFVDTQGQTSESIMPDFLHLATEQYFIWGQSIASHLSKIKFNQ